MICPKCGSRNVRLIGVSEDITGQMIHYLSCSECDHSWRNTAKKVAEYSNTAIVTTQIPKIVELPYELEINGIKYKRVE